MHMHCEHNLKARPAGHVHGIDPGVTAQADIVACTVCQGPPIIGVAVGWDAADGRHFGTALQVLGGQRHTDRAVAEIIAGQDWDDELAALLDGAASDGALCDLPVRNRSRPPARLPC
jgi:hypothetical protein